MSFNLVDIVKSQIGSEMMQHLGGMLGNESSKLDSGIASAVPGLINGLTKRASLPGGADSLLSTVNSQDSGLLDNMGSMLAGGRQNDLVDMGTKALTGLFGSSGLGSLGSIISSVSGLSKGGSSSILGIIAPIVIGQLKKKVMGDGLNASGLMSLLNSQDQNVKSAMPAGMLEQFESNSFMSDFSGDVAARGGEAVDAIKNTAGDVAARGSDAVGALKNTAGAAANTAGDAVESGGSWIKKVLPVAAVALVGILGWNFFSGGGESEVGNTAAVVSDATADFDVDALGTDLTGMFDNAKGTLEGITDAGSATAALPQLNELSDQLGGLTDMVGKVPETARGPLSGIISSGLESVTPVIEKVRGIPGVGEVIDPVIEPAIEKLQGFAG